VNSAVSTPPDDEGFWKDFLTMSSFFSPAVNPAQRHLGISSRDIFRLLGEYFGRKAAEKLRAEDLVSLVSELADFWKKTGIAKIEVDPEPPMRLIIRDCAVCGQTPETGRLFNCVFHEAFIESALSTKMGRKVHVRQEFGMEGGAGTWTRRYSIDINP